MFKRDRAASQKITLPVLYLLDSQKRVLFKDRLDFFPFPEAVILEAGLEFFNDPEPCEIHRRAVQLRLCAEMQLELRQNEDVPVDESLPLMLIFFKEYKPAYFRIEHNRNEGVI